MVRGARVQKSAPNQQTVPQGPGEEPAEQFVEVQVGDRVLKAVIHGGGNEADLAATTAALTALGAPQFANRQKKTAAVYTSTLPDPTAGLKAAEKAKLRDVSRQQSRDRKGSGDSAE
ncbi:unnamed protein product [Polarella glacialis]|uniref:Uncharacterized protein n=1 Tax=Polarella glacialis TaxID=89957 RepID=A0A813JIB4_POLGL|nr:unnamed protein product [Polarella glacialis]CAE8677381.1 unnamed protein product [Polarella glacialis]